MSLFTLRAITIQPGSLSNLEPLGTLEIRENLIATIPAVSKTLNSKLVVMRQKSKRSAMCKDRLPRDLSLSLSVSDAGLFRPEMRKSARHQARCDSITANVSRNGVLPGAGSGGKMLITAGA